MRTSLLYLLTTTLLLELRVLPRGGKSKLFGYVVTEYTGRYVNEGLKKRPIKQDTELFSKNFTFFSHQYFIPI